MSMDSIFRIFSVTLSTLALTLCLAVPVMAQADNSPASQIKSYTPAPPATAAPVINQSTPADGDEEVTILRDDYAGKYNPSTLENLSKLYWRLGAFDFDDDMAVGNYLKINECKLFTEYLNDDLEWKEIVKVMKDHLRKDRDFFPLNYQFVLEMHLGRYDPVKGGFPIVDRTGFIDAKRIEVDSIDRARQICFDSGAIKDYPKSLIVLLPKPFTLDFLKVDEHVAQAYILRKKAEYSKLPESVRVKSYEREAFLRLRITFSQYHGNLRGENAQIMSILFGNIDGYEIFEDAGQKRLMTSVDLLHDQSIVVGGSMSIPGDMQQIPNGVVSSPSAVPAPPVAAAPATMPPPAATNAPAAQQP